jgi:hypothetical protein
MQPEDPINIAGKDYKFDDLPPQAQKMIMFIQTVDNNLNSLDTQMQMMQITRDGCYSRLTQAVSAHELKQETDFTPAEPG